MADAMKQVRDALGEDAIIVSSREEAGGFKITAAIDKALAAPEPADTFSAEDGAEAITEALLKHRVPAAVSDKIISAALAHSAKNTHELLALALQKTFTFAPLPASKPLVLVGPPGAGKTLTTAKLAARLVMKGLKPTVITSDIARAGGIEQLSAFLDILGVPLGQAHDAKELKAHLVAAPKGTHVIVDTGGLNPFDPQEMKDLAKLLHTMETTPALVLPAGMDAEESAEMAMTFSVLGAKHLIPTRLDFARRIGGLLTAADRAGLTFAEGSHTPQVADGLLPLTAATLADFIIPRKKP